MDDMSDPFAPSASAPASGRRCATRPSARSGWRSSSATSAPGSTTSPPAWVMAEPTGSPLMVAAVQAATHAADRAARPAWPARWPTSSTVGSYLIVAQLWMLAVATALALLAHLGQLGPWSLLALTFALGIGAAMAMPAQAATTRNWSPRRCWRPAVALRSLSMNIARSDRPRAGWPDRRPVRHRRGRSR